MRSGAQRYELDSALGSNLDTRDQSGANTGLTEYDAYGREVYQDIFVDRGDFRFGGAHGYVNDDATGWQQLGARLYIPGIGRFLTQDPIGQEGGLNLYAYCGNSPLTHTDPSGLDKLIGRNSPYYPMIMARVGALEGAGFKSLGNLARGAQFYLADQISGTDGQTGLMGVMRVGGKSRILFTQTVFDRLRHKDPSRDLQFDTEAITGVLGHETIHLLQYKQGAPQGSNALEADAYAIAALYYQRRASQFRASDPQFASILDKLANYTVGMSNRFAKQYGGWRH